MLSEEAKAAMELLRKPIDPLAISADEMERRRLAAFAVARAMLDLFPVRTLNGMVIRWDDEITPERLVACGGKYHRYSADHICLSSDGNTLGSTLAYSIRYQTWSLPMVDKPMEPETAPRNMGEVWSLMERCWPIRVA